MELRAAPKTCQDGKLWYVCTAGPFTGCCSIDPCTDGICPDEDASTTTKSTKSSTTSESTRTSLSTTKAATETAEKTSDHTTATAIRTTSTVPATPAISATSVATATPTPTSTNSPSSHSSNGGMIGGIVGAVIGAIIIGLLLFFCIKPRRARNKITVHRSISSESLKAQDTGTDVQRAPLSEAAYRDLRLNVPPSLGSSNDTGISGPDDETPSSNISSLAISSLSNTNSTNLSAQTNRAMAPLIISRDPLEPLTPRAPGYVPELSDTGFRRQRAELASSPRPELINQQWQRTTQPVKSSQRSVTGSFSSGYTPGTTPVSALSSDTDLTSRSTPRRYFTRDGIFMGANLDRMPSIDEIEMTSPSQGSTTVSPPLSIQKTPKEMIRSSGNSPREPVKYTGAVPSNNQQQHVMSFMEYNSSTEMIERKAGGGEIGLGLGIKAESRDSSSKS